MQAEIISVGTELLKGDIVDANSRFLSHELLAFGIETQYQSTVGDDGQKLETLLRLALSRSRLIFISGGLGPTPDDLTRETVCHALGIPQELHEESWRQIEAYFARTGRELSLNNKKQAMLPAGCVVFPNLYGTAPGCAVEQDGKCIILLPGPPAELIPMFHNAVAPYLAKFMDCAIVTHMVGVFGLPESTVAERIADLLMSENPTVAPYVREGEVVLYVTAKAETQAAADALCTPVIADLRARLNVFVYGVDVDSLQHCVVSLLKEKGLKIATAESCTAGLLSGRLTEVPGASAVFECGVASYSNEIKHNLLGVPTELLEQYGAVSPAVACAMAIGVRRISEAAIGIGITGVAGPDSSEGHPAGTVYIALADEKRTWVKRITAGHQDVDREQVRRLATSHALDMARRYLEALPAVMAGGELIEPEGSEPVVIPATPKVRKRLEGKAALFRRIGLGVAIVLVAVLICIGVYVLFYRPYSNDQGFKELEDIYNMGSSANISGAAENYPSNMLAPFYALYDRNPDIKGWVKIDGTGISYPVMQSVPEDLYSNRDFDRNFSTYGVPYFSEQTDLSSSQRENRTLVIYGNNKNSGQMFSELTSYRDLSFLQSHPYITMNTIYENHTWEIFSVMLIDSRRDNAEFDYTRTDFDTDEEFADFIAKVERRSLYTASVSPTASDTLLFLSTDAVRETGLSTGRIVIAARQMDEEAGGGVAPSYAINRNVLLPYALRAANAADSSSPTTTEAPLDTTTTTAETTTSDPTASEETDPSGTSESSSGLITSTESTTSTETPTLSTDRGTHSTPDVTGPAEEEPSEDAAAPERVPARTTTTTHMTTTTPAAPESDAEFEISG